MTTINRTIKLRPLMCAALFPCFMFKAVAVHAIDFETPYGTLSEVRNNNQSVEYSASLVFNGEVIFKQEYGFVNIVKADVIDGVAYAVVSFGEGAMSCPAMFSVVEITAKNNISFSPHFGTCADLANIEFTSHGVEIAMPNYVPYKEYLTTAELNALYASSKLYVYSGNKVAESNVAREFFAAE